MCYAVSARSLSLSLRNTLALLSSVTVLRFSGPKNSPEKPSADALKGFLLKRERLRAYPLQKAPAVPKPQDRSQIKYLYTVSVDIFLKFKVAYSLLHTVNFDSLFYKLSRSLSAGTIDILFKALIADVHLSKLDENFIRVIICRAISSKSLSFSCRCSYS